MYGKCSFASLKRIMRKEFRMRCLCGGAGYVRLSLVVRSLRIVSADSYAASIRNIGLHIMEAFCSSERKVQEANI